MRCSKLTLPLPKASYTLCGGQNRLSQLLQASYTLYSAQNGLYQLPIRFVVLYTDFFAVVKTESTHFYKPSTSCTDVKTDSASLQHAFLQFKRNLRNFSSSPVVKTDCPQLYNNRTLFVILKTGNQNSTNPVPFLRGSKRNLPTFYTHPTRFAVVKMNSPNFYKFLKRSPVLETPILEAFYML